MDDLSLAPEAHFETSEAKEPRTPDRLYSLKEADLFLVCDAYGDVRGYVVEEGTGVAVSGASVLVYEPGAEKPCTRLPAASTRWHGTISGMGLRAIACPTARAASGPAPSSFATAP